MSMNRLTPFVRMRLLGCAILFLLAIPLDASAQTVTDEPTVVRIGVLLNTAPGGGSPADAPLAQYLSDAIPGFRFEVATFTRDEIVAQVRSHALDFVVVDPVLLAVFKTRHGFQEIATLQNRFQGEKYAFSGGTLFYHPESSDPPENQGLFTLPPKTQPVHPQDLKHRTIAISDPEALAGWLAALREFKKIGFKPDQDLKTSILDSDEAVVNAILEGTCEAGCVRAGTIERVVAERALAQDTFRVIEFSDIRDTNFPPRIPVAVSTRLYPNVSFAACPRAAPDLVEKVAAALRAMPPRTDGPGKHPEVAGWSFPRSDLAVHQCLQELRKPPYEQFGDISFRDVSRQYMGWMITLGALMVLMVMVTIYVLALNPAPWRAVLERRRAESALYVSVKRFEHIAACSGDWIWETDASDRFTYSNAIVEQMLGYPAEEIVGKYYTDLFAAAEKERIAALGQQKFGTGARMFRERFRLLTKDGRVVIHETTAEPIVDSRNPFSGYRGVNRDITNQVRFVRLRP